jgi:hypothetical protein
MEETEFSVHARIVLNVASTLILTGSIPLV